MEFICIVKKRKKSHDGKKKGGWRTVYNDVIICLREDLYYCFKCALILNFLSFFLFFAV